MKLLRVGEEKEKTNVSSADRRGGSDMVETCLSLSQVQQNPLDVEEDTDATVFNI